MQKYLCLCFVMLALAACTKNAPKAAPAPGSPAASGATDAPYSPPPAGPQGPVTIDNPHGHNTDDGGATKYTSLFFDVKSVTGVAKIEVHIFSRNDAQQPVDRKEVVTAAAPKVDCILPDAADRIEATLQDAGGASLGSYSSNFLPFYITTGRVAGAFINDTGKLDFTVSPDGGGAVGTACANDGPPPDDTTLPQPSYARVDFDVSAVAGATKVKVAQESRTYDSVTRGPSATELFEGGVDGTKGVARKCVATRGPSKASVTVTALDATDKVVGASDGWGVPIAGNKITTITVGADGKTTYSLADNPKPPKADDCASNGED